MKKKYNLILLGLFVFFNSCFNLEQDPYDFATDENLIRTVQDAQMAVNGIYATLRNNHEGESMYATDVQADFLNMAIIPETLPTIHRWADFSASNNTTATIWRNYFLIIQNVNIDLKAFDNVPNENTLEVLRGELYLARAFCYSYLVTHFCEAYNTAVATSQLGLPLATEQIVKDFPERSNLKETYDFILADIARAQTLLASKTGEPGADTFTVDAAKALKARILLYQNNWTEAYNTAKELIDIDTYPLVTSQDELQRIWERDDTAEAITQLYASITSGDSRELPTGTNNIYINYSGGYNPKLLPTQTFIDLFDTADYRKEVFLTQQIVNGESVYLVNKYPNNDDLNIYAMYGRPYYGHRPKLFRIPEIYLIAAEAAYRNGDVVNAQRYLNSLRTARGLTAVTATGEALFTEIQNERNRELCFEGVRMIDIKRWGLGVVRGAPQNMNLIITTNPSQYYQLNIAPNYYKMVWPLSPTDIQNEQGRWQQNTGW
ncbi:RagB/SusD family nutrient uptake outer membrane protein [Capnocytophaga sp. HP1101]